MSLLSESMERCTMLDETISPDGCGGNFSRWTDDLAFNAAITFDNSVEARIAEKQGVTSVYTVTTSKSITLKYHDVFRRTSDGKIFRVTSDGDDKFTPKSSSLDMKQVTAEEWSLPNE